MVFRGDSRSPTTIFEEGGFLSKGGNSNLLDHASGLIDDSAFISTSKSFDVAKGFAGNKGFVYSIKKSGGIDVNAKLGSSSPFPKELEIAFPLKIDAAAILRAQKVN